MEKRIFRLATPSTVHRMGQERKPFFKHGNGERIAKLRSSDRWQRLRGLVLCDNPLCAICSRPAYEVHHIKEAARHEELFFDQSNLVGLCENCHEKLHSAQKRGITIDVLFSNLTVTTCRE
jgi:hypothetical protein